MSSVVVTYKGEDFHVERYLMVPVEERKPKPFSYYGLDLHVNHLNYVAIRERSEFECDNTVLSTDALDDLIIWLQEARKCRS